jgi:hypothetical protein
LRSAAQLAENHGKSRSVIENLGGRGCGFRPDHAARGVLVVPAINDKLQWVSYLFGASVVIGSSPAA